MLEYLLILWKKVHNSVNISSRDKPSLNMFHKILFKILTYLVRPLLRTLFVLLSYLYCIVSVQHCYLPTAVCEWFEHYPILQGWFVEKDLNPRIQPAWVHWILANPDMMLVASSRYPPSCGSLNDVFHRVCCQELCSFIICAFELSSL